MSVENKIRVILAGAAAIAGCAGAASTQAETCPIGTARVGDPLLLHTPPEINKNKVGGLQFTTVRETDNSQGCGVPTGEVYLASPLQPDEKGVYKGTSDIFAGKPIFIEGEGWVILNLHPAE